MVHEQQSRLTLAIFCKVVDNYGDIGICWRLARQLESEHGVAVTLWVDDLASFRRICPLVDAGMAVQMVERVAVHHWKDQNGVYVPADIADIVIEFFACDIPPSYIEAMAQRTPRPVWLNLEGLTAEEWVEGCHMLPSMHPRLKLTKHFFFPGFTAKTGGLVREAGLETERLGFQSDPAAMAAFLASFGVTAPEMDGLKVSLFCYPRAPVAAMFKAWEEGPDPLTCLVPEGVASEAVAGFLGAPPAPGMAAKRGQLTVRVLPFVPQPDYDRLLWACQFNVVRGEDSFVRAQWAGRPFIWHIYPQDENLHHKKLRAFLQRYAPGLDSLTSASLCWNDDCGAGAPEHADWPVLWKGLRASLPELEARALEWQRQMHDNGDLATKLLQFAASLRQ